jgi:hypothetical protein
MWPVFSVQWRHHSWKLAELKCALVWRVSRWTYHRDPPLDRTIREGYKKFCARCSALPTRHTGRPGTSEDVECMWYSFLSISKKSMRQCSHELHTLKTTVHTILHIWLHLHVYKLQLQQIKEECRVLCFDRLVNTDYLWVVFTDEAIFHVSGLVSRHSFRTWGYWESQRNYPACLTVKINV